MLVSDENLKPVSDIPVSAGASDLPFHLDHPVFAGARIVDESAPVEVVRNRMHELGEAFFRQHGPRCVEMGWSVYPQSRGEHRRPAVIAGQSVMPSEYRDRLPTKAEVEFWAAKAPAANVALQIGPSSGYVFALDIDVDGDADQRWLTGLAFQHLGVTPLRRMGRRPALIYRRDPATPMRSSNHAFENGGGMIELLGDGKSLTIYGAHHSTGDYFRWPGADQPALVGPEVAPVVSPEQLRAFFDAVDHWKTLKGHRPEVVTHLESDVVEYDGNLNIPPRRMEIGTWEKRGEGKVLVDGRQDWAFRRAFNFVRFNADAVRTDDGAKAVCETLLGEAYRYMERSGSRWSNDAAIKREIEDIFKRTRSALLAERIRAATVNVDADGTRTTRRGGAAVIRIGGDLGEARGWVPEPGTKDRRNSPTKIVEKTDEDHKPNRERAEKLRLLGRGERIAMQKRVSGEVVAIIDSFLDRVWDEQERIAELIKGGKNPLGGMLRDVEALIAPTGAGKTSQFIRRFAAKVEERGRLPFAIAIYLPGHSNTKEAKAVAAAAGGIDVWDEAVQAARGLRMMIYKGKVAGGCRIADVLAKLQTAGVSTANACHSVERDAVTGEKVDSFCEHYDTCPVIAQRKLAQDADLILLAHAYLSVPLPAEVAERIGVKVIDESFWNEFVNFSTMPLDALRMARKDPYLTKSDKRDGKAAMDYRMERERAAEIATRALLAGDCPARALASYSHTTALKKRRIDGLDLVRSAKIVCGRSKDIGMSIRPNMQGFEVDAVLSRPEAEHAMVEWRFWSIIEEAIVGFRSGTKRADTREIRIKFLRTATTDAEGREVRRDAIGVSWRGRILMSNRPSFLLDASADENILRKIYGTRPVRVHRVDAPLHLRTIVVAQTFSDQSLIPNAPGNRKAEDRHRAAETLSKARHLISYAGALYPGDGVVVGSTKPVEIALQNGYAAPKNVSFGHYKAFAGLDVYREHKVAISFGRIELPPEVIDGLVRALSYDDPEGPEADWDVHGTGYLDGKKLRAPEGERRIQRRDGAVMTLKSSVYPEAYQWHRRVQNQWREEELYQFVGRLRPVYRDGEAPLWICCATCVPDGIIVDDVLTLNQLVKGAGTAELARRLGGVLDDQCGREHHDVLGSETLIREAIAGMPARLGGQYTTVRIWSDGEQGEGRIVRVVDWQHDLWSALANAERAHGRELDRYDTIEGGAKPNPKVMKPEPSKLDRQMSRLPHAATATREELHQERVDAEVHLREKVMEMVLATGEVASWAAIPCEGTKVSLEIAMILAAFPMPKDEAAQALEPDPPPIADAA